MDAQIWTTLIAGGVLVTILVGAGWAIMQSQFSAIEKERELKDASQDLDRANLRRELERREEEIKLRLTQIDEVLYRRSQEFVHQDEFRQFVKMMDDRWNTQADINARSLDAYLSVKAWEAWRVERDKLVQTIQADVRNLVTSDAKK